MVSMSNGEGAWQSSGLSTQNSRAAIGRKPATQVADEQKPMTEQESVDQLKRQSTRLPSAQYDLALGYLEGRGVQQDSEEALRLLKAAAAGGHEAAAKKLKELEAARAATPVQTNVPGPTAAPEPGADGRKGGP